MGLLDKIKKLNLFAGFSAIDDEFYDELEETLILSDMGMDTTLKAVEELRERVRGEKLKDRDEVRACLRRVLQDMLNVGDTGLALDTRPAVVLFIGVNGVGKTTTIGKLAAGLKAQGKKVLLCAGDTFRAAAADQLTVWSQRAGVDIVKQHEGADPAAVVFDATAAAKARGVCGAGLLFRYPIRVAVNPMVSTVGWMLPNIVSGESIVAVVLNLQTLGPVLLKALQTQDMYLAGSILLMTSILSLVGTLLSDILLAALDPRIRIGGGTAR